MWFRCHFGCGGGIWTSRPPGYEPDELPSCSTPRYSISRASWCRKPGSNRYDTHVSRDFKSRASANSAIPAKPISSTPLRHAHLSSCYYYSTDFPLCQPLLGIFFISCRLKFRQNILPVRGCAVNSAQNFSFSAKIIIFLKKTLDKTK